MINGMKTRIRKGHGAYMLRQFFKYIFQSIAGMIGISVYILAGFIAIGFSVYGFILGLKSFSEENRNVLYSKVGAVANGLLTVLWITMFLIGIG